MHLMLAPTITMEEEQRDTVGSVPPDTEPAGPPALPPQRPAPAAQGEAEPSYYVLEIKLRFLGPAPEGAAAVHPLAAQLANASNDILPELVRNTPELTYSGMGYGVRRIA